MCAWAAGTYTKGNASTGGWTGDASLGIGIEAGRHDTQDNDFATGINQCINKDGSNAFTGDPNLGGFKPTNIAAGTAAAPALCVGGDVNTGVFGPAADTWAVSTNGTERVRVDSSGRIGVNVTPFANSLGNGVIDLNGNGGIWSASNSSYVTTNAHYDSAWKYKTTADARMYIQNVNGHVFYTAISGNAGDPISWLERVRIDSGGNVGIASSGPAGRLDVRSAYADADDFVVGFAIGANYYFKSKLVSRHTTGSAANVFIDPSNHILQRSTSSARYKTNIEDYTRGIDAVSALRPVFYKGINDGEKQFAGLIAEEVHEAGLTEFVSYNDENQPDALHYGNMVALAFKAIQELNAKVEALEAKIAELTSAPTEEPA